MDMLDNNKLSLDNNENLSEDVRNNIFELVILFNQKFPTVKLDNLNERLKTIKIQKTSKFINKDVSMYDFRNNIIYFNLSEVKKGYDMKHVLMYELINVISSTHYQMGFNANNQFEALNTGYTEILANYVTPNESEKMLYPKEAIEANLIATMIGSDSLFNSYFNNDARMLVNCFVHAGVQI